MLQVIKNNSIDKVASAFVKQTEREPVLLYLVGPIAGTTLKEAVSWRDYVTARLISPIKALSPIRNHKEWENKERGEVQATTKDATVRDKALAVRSFMDAKRAAGIFAYLPKELNERRPSYGSISEMAIAYANGNYTILVTDDPYLKAHPLVQETVGWNADSLDEGIYVANTIFGVY